MIGKSIKVSIAPSMLRVAFEEVGLDEQEIKDRFLKSAYCDLVAERGPNPKKFAVLYNTRDGRFFLFTCRKSGQETWEITNIEETVANMRHTHIAVLDYHLVLALKAFNAFERNYRGGSTYSTFKISIKASLVQGKEVVFRKRYRVGSVRVQDFESFKGDGLDFLRYFVPLSKLDKVTYPEGSKVVIELYPRHKAVPLHYIPLTQEDRAS